MKNKKVKKCRVYYLQISKHMDFRICFYPCDQRVKINKVKFMPNGDEKTIKTWMLVREQK